MTGSPPSHTRRLAGGSLATPDRIVLGAGTYWYCRNRARERRSTTRSTVSSSSTALSSEPYVRRPCESRQYNGFLPKRSRAKTSRLDRLSHKAIANMPRSEERRVGKEC